MTDRSGLPSNSVSAETTHSSTRSYISSTSTPILRKISRCGLCPGRGEAVGGDVVDRVLPALHAADVFGQRDRLLVLVAMGRRESQQRGDALLVGGILDDAFLERAAELLPERRVLFRLVFRQSSSSPSTRLTDAARIVSTISRLLQDFARDVERQVVRVDDAADEAQIRRHQLLGVVHDEDAPHVQLDAVAMVAVPEIERRARRDEEQLGVLLPPSTFAWL